jgi:UDP:flavonoid glycosyltransferase YjiC (YdhE family)
MEATQADVATAVTRLLAEPQFRESAAQLGQAMARDMASPMLASELEEIAARPPMRLRA